MLDLSNNDIARLPTSAFVDLRRLELLNISHNAVAELSPGAFTGLGALLELHLASNDLRSLPKVLTARLRLVQQAELSDWLDSRWLSTPPQTSACWT